MHTIKNGAPENHVYFECLLKHVKLTIMAILVMIGVVCMMPLKRRCSSLEKRKQTTNDRQKLNEKAVACAFRPLFYAGVSATISSVTIGLL